MIIIYYQYQNILIIKMFKTINNLQYAFQILKSYHYLFIYFNLLYIIQLLIIILLTTNYDFELQII